MTSEDLDESIQDQDKSKRSQLGRLLGQLGKGKPKNFSQAERRRRAKRLADVRAKRWPAKV